MKFSYCHNTLRRLPTLPRTIQGLMPKSKNCRSGGPAATACKMIGKTRSEGRHAIGESEPNENFFDAIQKLQKWRTGGAGMQNDTENRLGGPARDRGFGITRNFDRQFRNWQGDELVAPACKMIKENQYYARSGTTERQPLSQVHCARPRIPSLPRGGWGGRTGVSATSAPVRPLDGVADASSMALFHDVRCAYDRSYP